MTARGLIGFHENGVDCGAPETPRPCPSPDYAFSPSRIAHIRANDVDEAAEQIRDWRVDLTQLQRGPARMDGILVPLGNTLVGRGRCTRAISARGFAPSDSVSFLFNGSEALGRAGSLMLDANTCIVYGSGAELNNYLGSDMLSVAVSIASTKWLELQHVLAFDLACGDGRSRRLTTSPQCIRSVVAILNEVCNAVEGAPDRSIEPRRIAAFEDSVLTVVASMLGTPLQGDPSTRERASRYRAVMRAQEYIHANLGEPLSLLRLCDVSLASARTLEYGFQELFGIPPLTYVRFERLGRVHRELHRADRTEASVTDVAMRWGFWHLGQFSKEYRGLFGESPSATLSRAKDKSSHADLSPAGASAN